jgi:hypothetical protein
MKNKKLWGISCTSSVLIKIKKKKNSYEIEPHGAYFNIEELPFHTHSPGQEFYYFNIIYIEYILIYNSNFSKGEILTV